MAAAHKPTGPVDNRPQAKDPTQFFLNQHNDISDDKKSLAYEFARKLMNDEKCPICKSEYNLNECTPKVLVQCGHTICFRCLEHFYRGDKIRCPICLKLHKKIPSLEVLPTNHTLHAKLLKKIPHDQVNPFFEKLMLPADIIASLPPSKTFILGF